MNMEVKEFDTLCNLVYKTHGLTNQAPWKTRRTNELISMPNVKLQTLVPSPSGILQHIKQVFIQSGYFWKLSEIETNILYPIV